eukprot:6848736-Prymnesium_polylepis.1
MQKGLHTDEQDRSVRADEIAHPGAKLPVHVYNLGDPQELEVIIIDFQKHPFKKPPVVSGRAKPRLAAYTKMVETFHRGNKLLPEPMENASSVESDNRFI